MTDQRLTLYVPDTSFTTSMNLGSAWAGTPPGAGTAWNGRGLCVNSTGRIWLDANGSSASTSTFGALSNAPVSDTEAGLLYQSLASWVYSISKETNITTSNSSVFIAGGSGIKIMAGHGAPILPFGIDAGTSTQIANVRPDETTPSSAYAATYTDYVDDVATAWTITDTVVAGALTLLDVGLMIAQCYKSKSRPAADLGTGLMVMGSCANLAGMGVNIGGMAGGDTPGIQVHASSSVNFATTGFCSVHSGAGMLLFGVVTSGLGFVTAGVTGFVSAALTACLMVGVEGANTSITAGGGDLEIAGKTGKCFMTAAQFQVGTHEYADTTFAKTQLTTQTVKAEAVTELSIESLGTTGTGLSMDSGGSTILEGGTIDVTAATTITIRSPAYDIIVSVDSVTFAAKKTTSVKLGADSAVVMTPDGNTLQINSNGILMGGPTSNVKVEPAGKVTWTSGSVSFL